MRGIAALAAFGLTIAATAADESTPSYGAPACAQAEVTARIEKFEYESIKSDDPNYVVLDVLYHFHVQVLGVAFGPVHRGPLEVLYFADGSSLQDIGSTWHLYLKWRPSNHHWYIADCNKTF